MHTELKEVAHLYLGRRHRYRYVDWSEGHWSIWSDLTPVRLAVLLNDASIAEAQLDLRPLSDMKHDEAKHFAWICMDSEHHLGSDNRISEDEIDIELHKNDGGLLLDDDIEIYIEVNVRCFDGAVLIKTDGTIGILNDVEQPDNLAPVDNIAQKILYLTKQGFDLFRLTEAAQAVDANTENRESE